MNEESRTTRNACESCISATGTVSATLFCGLLLYVTFFFTLLCLEHVGGSVPVLKELCAVARRDDIGDIVCESDCMKCREHLEDRENNVLLRHNVTAVWAEVDCSGENRLYSPLCSPNFVAAHDLDYFVWFHVDLLVKMEDRLRSLSWPMCKGETK